MTESIISAGAIGGKSFTKARLIHYTKSPMVILSLGQVGS
jgi:hypothetical protein